MSGRGSSRGGSALPRSSVCPGCGGGVRPGTLTLNLRPGRGAQRHRRRRLGPAHRRRTTPLRPRYRDRGRRHRCRGEHALRRRRPVAPRRPARRARTAARVSAALPDAIRKAGGAEAVRRCRPVHTASFNGQLVAWELHLHEGQVGNRPQPPGTLVVPTGSRAAGDPLFRSLAQTPRWTIASTCPGPSS
jgi:hypothetical protein